MSLTNRVVPWLESIDENNNDSRFYYSLETDLKETKEVEDGTYKRDQSNKEMEVKFNRLLGDIERIALLTNNKAI